MAESDYIIVGAGAAGCVLAYRLTEDPAVKVVLLEAGGKDDNLFIHMPRGLAKVMSNLRYIWPFATKPEPGSNNVAELWARGRTLGGSSAVNGMVYVRGSAPDFDALAEQTSDDWNWSHIGGAYREMEAHELGPGPTRGGSGPLKITLSEYRSKLTEAVIAAGEAMGLRRMEDVNDPADSERVGYAPRTIYKGKRQSAATAFLRPAMKRPNLTVYTGVQVDRVLFDGTRAIGVAASRDGRPVSYAAKEIIISGGALASPAILQRSGIGPADLLKSLDIPVISNNRAVGADLFEHRGIVFQWRVPDALSQNRYFRGWGLVRSALSYFLRSKGALTGGAYDLGAWVKSDPSKERPDLQILMSPYSFDFQAVPLRIEDHGGLNFCVYGIRPDSRGKLSIVSPNPSDLPEIVPAYASDAENKRTVKTMVDYVRRYVQQAPLARYIEQETRPGSRFSTDEEIETAYLQYGYANYHASGTCRMGKDAASAVDPQLRVRGVRGVRVVDTSVFPFMLAGNTNAPTMAIAWRAADIIRRAAEA